MRNGFIKNKELLKESHKVDDLLDFSVAIEQFEKRIGTIIEPSILALVGPFGVGKSTMLYQVQMASEPKSVWINFDAWKYPDRQNLWEGFVLDFAKEVSPEEFQKVEKKVKGKQNDDKKTLIKVLSRIPGFAALEGLNHFFETSPARRVDEIQNILKEQISKINGDLYIVVEDIDRSGDSGIFFLETLRQFVSNLEKAKKVLVIVPMSDTSYYKNLDSYLKSIDYFEFFQPSEVKLVKFVDEIFDEQLFEGQFNRNGDSELVWTGDARKSQTISFLEWLFHEHNQMSMRLLKLILRKANLVYINQINDGHEPDFRVTLCIEASKYISLPDDPNTKYFDDFKKRGAVPRGNVFCSYLIAMFWNKATVWEQERVKSGEEKMLLIQAPGDINFIGRKNNSVDKYPSHPWSYEDPWSDDTRHKFGITSFYLDY